MQIAPLPCLLLLSSLPPILFTPGSPSSHTVNLTVTETALVGFSVSSFQTFPNHAIRYGPSFTILLPCFIFIHSRGTLWHHVYEQASDIHLIHVFMQLILIEHHHVSGTGLGSGEKWTGQNASFHGAYHVERGRPKPN